LGRRRSRAWTSSCVEALYRRWGISPRPENASIFRQSGNRFAVENAPDLNLRVFLSQNRYPLLRNTRRPLGMSGLKGIMAKRRPPGKRLWHGNWHGPHAVSGLLRPHAGAMLSPSAPRRHGADLDPAKFCREKLTIATPIQIRFRFVPLVNDRPVSFVGNFTAALWTDSTGSCADSANHIS
jgi:hypothetical protein